MTERAPFSLSQADVPILRESLRKLAAAGYSESRVRGRLGLEDLADLQWRHVPIYRSEHLADRDTLALAIDLFLLQGSLRAAELARLFTAAELAVLIRAGLVAIVQNQANQGRNDGGNEDGTSVARARASLFPIGDRLIFSDHAWPELPHPGYAAVPCDHVMAVGPDSRKLARCTVRRPFRSALDLCTGSGIQALLASAHTGRVLAVDINPRAAQCTRFNALAAGVTNLEVLAGDLFEGVKGERFDLITANPPFVPSPVDAVQFRDGGRSGEDIQRRIVAGLPRHLAPNGRAQIVTELGERDGETLVLRLREWLQGAPMDIHILRLGEHAAAQYAIGHAKGDNYDTFLDSTNDWAGNLRAQGYVRVVSVVISFQWSDPTLGPPWERVDESPPPRRMAGSEIDAAFLAERSARRRDWQQLLQHSRLRRAGPIAVLDARVLGSGVRAKVKATLLGQALKIEHQLDPVERDVLQRMNGDGIGENDRCITVPDLIGSFRAYDEPAVLAAARSLVRRQLVHIEALNDEFVSVIAFSNRSSSGAVKP